ncbi:hypothetical protein B0T19DRAFT_468472 [Cercophora scortea]|uniref:Uncharacterized protein n=1 Tax=Cercophora scortea TaxID=314031 RepID=A0AAE0I854_9PEZI|nr:hypothetical protein B0T19DRAFT_468472 [Cercophora scortea]
MSSSDSESESFSPHTPAGRHRSARNINRPRVSYKPPGFPIDLEPVSPGPHIRPHLRPENRPDAQLGLEAFARVGEGFQQPKPSKPQPAPKPKPQNRLASRAFINDWNSLVADFRGVQDRPNNLNFNRPVLNPNHLHLDFAAVRNADNANLAPALQKAGSFGFPVTLPVENANNFNMNLAPAVQNANRFDSASPARSHPAQPAPPVPQPIPLPRTGYWQAVNYNKAMSSLKQADLLSVQRYLRRMKHDRIADVARQRAVETQRLNELDWMLQWDVPTIAAHISQQLDGSITPREEVDPLSPAYLPPLLTHPRQPFTPLPGIYTTLPLLRQERIDHAITVKGSSLGALGSLYPNATFLLCRAPPTARGNNTVRFAGHALRQLALTHTQADRRADWVLSLRRRDWPSGGVALVDAETRAAIREVVRSLGRMACEEIHELPMPAAGQPRMWKVMRAYVSPDGGATNVPVADRERYMLARSGLVEPDPFDQQRMEHMEPR